MKDTITLRMQGLLTAVSPIATCPPGNKAGNNEPAPLPKIYMNGVKTPYLPGAALRGTLRRKGGDVIRDALSRDGVSPFSLDDHYYLVLGGVKGDEKEDKVDILNSHARRLANPLIGLFGSGIPWQRSHLYVAHAVPRGGTGYDAVRGARVDDFARSGENLRLLTPDEQELWVARAKVNNERSKKKREELKPIVAALKATDLDAGKREKLQAQMKKIEAEIKEMSGDAGGANSVNRPLDGYEVITPGTEMAHSFDLSFVTADEIGLFMAALRFWSLDPWVGAHRAHGCGLVSGHWDVSVRVGLEPQYRKMGAVTMTPFEGITGPDDLMAAEQAFLEALRAEDSRFDFRFQSQAA
jgi:CRISPR type IV-associated protein Csf2